MPYWASPDKPRRYLHIAPSEAKATVELAPELRKRGLFHSVVYTAEVRLSGRFVMPPDISAPDRAALLWPEAFVILTASDLRALKSSANLDWSRPRAGVSVPAPEAGLPPAQVRERRAWR